MGSTLRRSRLLPLALVCFGAGIVAAETMLQMTLEQLVSASDIVIHGQVVEAASRWGDEQRTVIWTDYVVNVEDVLHGRLDSKSIVVTQMGGSLAGKVQTVGSNPDFWKGDEVVLMLAKADFLRGMARGDNRAKFTIVGVAQGTYYVVREEGQDIAFKDYAHLAIVPRPRQVAPERQSLRTEAIRAEIQSLQEEAKKRPEDRELRRRLAMAERLLASAPEPPKPKPRSETEKYPRGKKERADLGAKPAAQEPPPSEMADRLPDARPDADREARALKEALQIHAARFQRITEPILLSDLKARIRATSRQAPPRK